MPFIPWIISFLTGIAGFIVKHPFVSKMMIFVIFTGLLTAGINFMLSKAQPYIMSNSAFSLAAYLGVIQAISLYLTLLIAGWGVKQVIAFVRS